MNCPQASAANTNRLLIKLKGARLETKVLSRILLMILASCIPADTQNAANLTIQGVMPAAQRLSLSAIQNPSETNRIVVTLAAENNAAAGYAVTIKSKTPSAGTNGYQTNYQLKYGGRSITLAPGTSRVLSACTGDRSARTILQISNASAFSDDSLTLTVITQ